MMEIRMDLSTSLTYLKGVGPGRGAMLEAKGLHTVEDLLSYFPFRYEDRSNMKTIAPLAPGLEPPTGAEGEGPAALHVGRIVPIYEAVAKISTRVLRTLIHNTLAALKPAEDELPTRIRERLRLPDRWTAIRDAHFPGEGADLRLLNSFRSPAHFRLIF